MKLYAALCRLYVFCVRLCASLRNVCGFAYVVRIFQTFMFGFAQCMRRCVGCTDFAYVCVRICAIYAALRRLYVFCVRMCMAFAR